MPRSLPPPATAILRLARRSVPHRPLATSARRQAPARSLSTSRTQLGMASDEDYMAFLAKADRDLHDARATATTSAAAAAAEPFRATDGASEVPRVIRDAMAERVYVSDADEPFTGVSLQWRGDGLPDEESFAALIRHWDPPRADIEILDPADWDAHGSYAGIVAAVEEATHGNDVRVYRVPRGAARVEYWVVSRDDGAGRIVGVKALGVES